jgi:hypothetical protein
MKRSDGKGAGRVARRGAQMSCATLWLHGRESNVFCGNPHEIRKNHPVFALFRTSAPQPEVEISASESARIASRRYCERKRSHPSNGSPEANVPMAECPCDRISERSIRNITFHSRGNPPSPQGGPRALFSRIATRSRGNRMTVARRRGVDRFACARDDGGDGTGEPRNRRATDGASIGRDGFGHFAVSPWRGAHECRYSARAVKSWLL